MSLAIAEQLHKTIISEKVCKGCTEYSWEHIPSKHGIIGISFCKTKWFGGKCKHDKKTLLKNV